MKIYESHSAPNPRRVRMFLAEKGIEVPYQEIDIVKAVNRGEDFRRKNPLSTVPVLELDDGTCISESVAICRYFEEVHPQPPLFGTEVSGSQIEQLIDEPILLANSIAADPPRLPCKQNCIWSVLSRPRPVSEIFKVTFHLELLRSA